MVERKDVRIGVDVKAVRVGVVRHDPDGIFTMPIETPIRQENRSDTDHTDRIVGEFLVIEVTVGLPRHLKGGEGVSTKAARRYALGTKTFRPEIRVALVDKRLTLDQVYARLRASGISEKDHRSITDQVAAQIIPEQALEEERMSGRVPGREITLGGSNAQ